MTNTERTYIAETLEQLMYRSTEEGYTGERDALTYAIINLNKTISPLKRREDPYFSVWFEKLWGELHQ